MWCLLEGFSSKIKLSSALYNAYREKLFACQVCDKKFAQKSTLVRHQTTHSDVRSFKCSVCPEGRFYKSKYELNRHMVYHYEPKFSCIQCDFKTHTKCNLKKHEKNHIKK